MALSAEGVNVAVVGIGVDVATMTLTAVDVVVIPALLVAFAVSEYVPAATLLHVML